MIRANYLHLEPLLSEVLDRGVAGDWAEFGVWHGTTFVPMAELARRNGRVVHAVDSFRGMAAPTAADGDQFVKGSLSVGGSRVFRDLVRPYGEVVVVHEGYVPAILNKMNGLRFAFAHVDLDQYAPTLATLRYLWPRMESGGVVVCHDWAPDRRILAGGAIAYWITETHTAPTGESLESGHCWFVR